MDWSEERYVRVYTRDTADLLAFGFEGRAVWWELIRKLDRAGVLEHGGEIEVVADLLRIPLEFFQVGIARIAKRGCVKLTETAIVVPNFIEAQEALQSDRTRQRESRGKRLAAALASGASPEEARAAARPDRFPGGTKVYDSVGHDGSHGVTAGHTGSHGVTPSLAVPSLAEPKKTPCPAVPADEVRAEPPEAMDLARLLAEAIESRAKDQPKDLRPDRRDKTLASWAREFRLAHERDGRPWPRLQKVLEWSQADAFWAANIRSASKFRAQFDALAARMEQPATRPNGGRQQAEPPKYKDDGYVY